MALATLISGEVGWKIGFQIATQDKLRQKYNLHGKKFVWTGMIHRFGELGTWATSGQVQCSVRFTTSDKETWVNDQS